jgi:hypothetical protein
MAEPLGVTASVIGIAQLAATIVSLGAKTRELLKDIQDTPEEIQLRLEQLELIALSLKLTADGRGALLEEAHPLLQKSRLHCNRCLSALQDMLETLSGQIQRSKGIRKKLILAKAVLNRGVFDKIERHLEHSVEILSIAHQVYTM